MYRSAPDAGCHCARHPAAVAIGLCAHCHGAVCIPCGLYDGLQLSCPRCLPRVRLWRRWAFVLGAAFTIELAVLGYCCTGFDVRDLPNWQPFPSASSALR